jgi:hypothetical protein
VQLGCTRFPGSKATILILQLLGFATVIGFAIAPGLLVPVLRVALIFYALGLCP